MNRLLLCLLISLFALPTITAQDALNLPTELYILLNEGRVERYGLGAEGVTTITPEDTFVVDFGIASDDNWMAYRTPDGLYISNVYNSGQSQVIDESADAPSVRGEGDTLVWSPNDLYVAYVTLNGVRVYFRDSSVMTDIPVNQVRHIEWSPSGEFLLAETVENIWWIYRRVGTQMNLASVIPTSHGIEWLSDTVLIFAPVEGGLLTMDLNDNNAQTTILPTSDVYHLPVQVSEDVYRVLRANGDTGFGRLVLLQISADDIVTEDIGEGDVELGSVRWSPGGNLLIAFQGGVMALVDPISAQGFTLPVTNSVSYDWGTVQTNITDTLIVEGNLYFLGEDVMGIRQVWTIDETGNPLSITPATGEITDYDISGNLITYVSQDQLWLYNRADDEVVSLVDAEEPIHTPRFSPSAGQIAYSVETVDNSRNGGIWLYTIADESNELILANGAASTDVVSPPFYSQPFWASNINALLVTASGSESTSLSVLDVNTFETVPIGQYDHGFWLQDGRVVAWGSGSEDTQASEIVILDPNTQGEPIPLFTLPTDIVAETLTQISANELRLIMRQNLFGPSSSVVVRIPINGTSERLDSIPPIVSPIFSSDGEAISGLTNPDGSLVIYQPENKSQSILQFPIRIAKILWE